MEMDDAPLTRDILGNLLEEPEIIEDDTSQDEDEEISMPIKIIGWIIALIIVGIMVAIIGFIFILLDLHTSIFSIIIIIGLLGALPTLFLTGKL